MKAKPQYIIGVDTGCTFIDVIVIDQGGRPTISKAETTLGELGKGMLIVITIT